MYCTEELCKSVAAPLQLFVKETGFPMMWLVCARTNICVLDDITDNERTDVI